MQITNTINCVGCAVCEFSCPVNAIKMEPLIDRLGFLYPIVDETKCVSCKKCKLICTANRQINKNHPLRYEIAQTNNIDDLCTTTSGGVATALAKLFIHKLKGVVYGAALTQKMKVVQTRCVTVDDCDKLKGSKYVQSDSNSVHNSILDDLKEGLPVLYIGTPCQCASMVDFSNYPNFYMCDLVCNGVGSPEVFGKHIEYIERQHKQKITNYVFRPKTSRYLESCELVVFNDTKAVRLFSPWDKWGTLYYNALVMRESCYSCKFTTVDRVGDLTFSDVPEQLMDMCRLNDVKKNGATYLSVNTLKGDYLMEFLHETCSRVITEGVQKGRMKEPVSKPPLTQAFISCYLSNSLEKAKIKVFGTKYKIKCFVIKLINNFGK